MTKLIDRPEVMCVLDDCLCGGRLTAFECQQRSNALWTAIMGKRREILSSAVDLAVGRS